MKTLNNPDLGFVRENGRDQGDTFARDGRIVDQTFPRWRATDHGKLVRLTTHGLEKKTDKPRKIRNTSDTGGRR